MKKLSLFLVLCAALTANAVQNNASQDTIKQDTIKIEPRWKEGDSDSYRFIMSAVTAMGDFVLETKVSQKVSKVYENGDADIVFTNSDTKITVNGTEMEGGISEQRTYTVRLNKQGMPVSKGQQGGGFGVGLFQYFQIFGDKPLKIGESTNIEYVFPQNAKNTLKGTITLESVEKGVAKFVSKFDISNEQTDKPMKLVSNSWVDTSTGKLEKAEGTMSNLPSFRSGQVDAIQFVIERIKK